MRDFIHGVLIVLLFVILLALAGGIERSDARPVSLSDARVPPTKLAYLLPGEQVTYAHGRYGFNCRHGYFSDVSAYRWNGKALKAQRWNRDHTETFWSSHDDFAVTFDGITFFNDTERPVIVAGWCE